MDDAGLDAEGFFKLGLEYAEHKEFSKAMDAFDAAVVRDPGHVEALFNLGNILLEENKHDMALRHFRKALRANANHAPSLFNAGLCYAALGMKIEAGNAFKKFLGLDSSREWQHEARYQLKKLGE